MIKSFGKLTHPGQFSEENHEKLIHPGQKPVKPPSTGAPEPKTPPKSHKSNSKILKNTIFGRKVKSF